MSAKMQAGNTPYGHTLPLKIRRAGEILELDVEMLIPSPHPGQATAVAVVDPDCYI